MESRILNEQIDFEARRVAAAFGIEEWQTTKYPAALRHFGRVTQTRLPIDWVIDIEEEIRLTILSVGSIERCSQLAFYLGEWDLRLRPKHAIVIARGLYCLGFEEESILSQLPPLSAHEKIELRLNFPRGFWPQKWLDEEGEINHFVSI